MKLGGAWIDAGAASFLSFTRAIDNTKSGKPVALAVIMPDGYAYLRSDGVDCAAAVGPRSLSCRPRNRRNRFATIGAIVALQRALNLKMVQFSGFLPTLFCGIVKGERGSAMPVHVAVQPELLRWAVNRAGLSMEQLQAENSKLSEWLSGEKQPTLTQLETFAARTRAPIGQLFLAEPPEEQLPIADMRTIGSDGVRRPSANLLDTIYLCQLRQDWYRDYALEQGFDEVAFVGSVKLELPPHEVAEMIRELLAPELQQLGSTALEARSNLAHGIERRGVLVMINGVVGANSRRKLDVQEFRGFALADRYAPVIFVNGADTKTAQVFTLIHELAHLFLGHSALSDTACAENSSGLNAEELWCNAVAAEVLVPEQQIRELWNGACDTESLRHLSKRFKVSGQVILRRLFDLEFLTWEKYQHLLEEQKRLSAEYAERQDKQSGGDFYRTHPLRVGGNLVRAVAASVQEGGTSYRDGYQLLGVAKHETFEKLIGKVKSG